MVSVERPFVHQAAVSVKLLLCATGGLTWVWWSLGGRAWEAQAPWSPHSSAHLEAEEQARHLGVGAPAEMGGRLYS